MCMTKASQSELLSGAIVVIVVTAGCTIVSAQQRQLGVGTPECPVVVPYRTGEYDGPVNQPVHISAARRELEPFMLYVLGGQGGVKNARVSVSSLTRDDGRGAIGVNHIQVAPMTYVKASTHGLTTDPSLALEAAALRYAKEAFVPRILRPDVQRFDVPAGARQAVWVTVDVPPTAAPGTYSGTVTVQTESATAHIPVKLLVRGFTLPEIPSMPAYTHWSPYSKQRADKGNPLPYPQDICNKYARFIIRQRWRVGRIYQKMNDSAPLPDAGTVRRWASWGGRGINLLRIDTAGRGELTTDPQTGNKVLKDEYLEQFWKLLDDRIAGIKQAGLLDFCYLYGFDERPRSEVSVISDAFGRAKARYGDITTMVPSCEWTALGEPQLKNVDIMGYITHLLSPELRDLHHRRGERIIWYNISRVGMVVSRVQFWAVYKDNLDGVLFYSMAADGSVRPLTEDHFPLLDRTDRAPMQYLADGPTSTTILEMWREGLEDADYLALLREQLDRVKAATKGKDTSKELRRLIARAEYYGSVPDSVTRGKFAEARIYQTYRPLWDVLGHKECRRIEAALVVKSSTDSMAHIMYVRSRVAESIEALSKIE